jgi:hypothetical protein
MCCWLFPTLAIAVSASTLAPADGWTVSPPDLWLDKGSFVALLEE